MRERHLTEEEAREIQVLIERRCNHEPVSRILGLREFWGLPFALNEATLDPRADSETLIETSVRLCSSPPKRILDLGTGTGCLLLALLHEYPQTTGLGIDISPRAVEQAQQNAEQLDLSTQAKFMVNNWLENIVEKFDLIISNPPYIASTDIPHLMPEVKDFDPMLALDGGEDGLAPYRFLIPQLPNYLNAGGIAVFEIGQGQAAEVSSLFRKTGFSGVAAHNDLGDIKRCISGFYQ
jgi:release factor glutamine methyltransferase